MDKEKSKKLFIHNLIPNRPKCAEVALLGDLHLGYPTVDKAKLKKDIQELIERKCYVILMGDLIEVGTRDSVGDSLFFQECDPQKQMDMAFNILCPLMDAKLLLGSHRGNHEDRVYKNTGVDIARILAQQYFHIPYFGYSAYHLFKVGDQNYTAFTTHGSTGATLPYTKMKSLIDYGRYINTHIIASGHTHELNTYTANYKEIDLRHRQVATKKKYFILTGSYLGYEDSYAEKKGMMPTKTGYARLKLYKDTWDVFVSI